MIDREQAARENFLAGCNCAQSVLLAFSEDYGLDREQALLMTAALGGGVARLREVCGAFNAAAMVLGLDSGSADPADKEAKAALYRRVQAFAERFRAECGSVVCRDNLNLPKGPDDPEPAPRTQAYYRKRPCPEIIAHTAKMLAEEIFQGQT